MSFDEYFVGQWVQHGNRSSKALVRLKRLHYEEKTLIEHHDVGYLEIIEIMFPGAGYCRVWVHKWRNGWSHTLVGFDTVENAKQALEAVWTNRAVEEQRGFRGQSPHVWFYGY